MTKKETAKKIFKDILSIPLAIARIPGMIIRYFFPPQIDERWGGYHYLTDCTNEEVKKLAEIMHILQEAGGVGRALLQFRVETILKREKRGARNYFLDKEKGEKDKWLTPEDNAYCEYKMTKNLTFEADGAGIETESIEVECEVASEKLDGAKSKDVAVTASDGNMVTKTAIEGWN